MLCKNDELVNSTINDIVKYLSHYIDVTEIKEKYNSCKYYFSNAEENKIRLGKYIHTVKLPEEGGSTITPIYYENSKYKIVKPICFVSNKTNDKLKQVLFHELMHVGSIKQEIKNGKYNLKSGIIEETSISKFNPNIVSNNLNFFNEALTELVAKIIYDGLYIKKYKIVGMTNFKIYCSGYCDGYFLLAFLLLNYFEKNKKILFDIYFNNNIPLLKKVIEEQTGQSFEWICSIMEGLKNPTEDIKVNLERYIESLDKKNRLQNKNVRKQYNLKRTLIN